jgi:hypothetical protein
VVLVGSMVLEKKIILKNLLRFSSISAIFINIIFCFLRENKMS